MSHGFIVIFRWSSEALVKFGSSQPKIDPELFDVDSDISPMCLVLLPPLDSLLNGCIISAARRCFHISMAGRVIDALPPLRRSPFHYQLFISRNKNSDALAEPYETWRSGGLGGLRM